ANWQAMFQTIEQAPFISVNLSEEYLSEPGFLSEFQRELQQSGLNPHLLQLEVNETVFTNPAQSKLPQLITRQGIGLCLDDFGVGYSSLSCLHRHPIQSLKLDRFFFNRDAEASPRNREVIRAIVNLCQDLRIHTIAEGVENSDQADFLIAIGCPGAQGHAFHTPINRAELSSMLSRLQAQQESPPLRSTPLSNTQSGSELHTLIAPPSSSPKPNLQ
ncbi:MAG: EAL domain-containing protein, partial [Myxococcota bacterium]